MMRLSDDKDTPSPAWIEELRRRYPTEPTIDETLTRKMQRRPGEPHQPQTLQSVFQRLSAFLEKRIDGQFTISNLRSLAGGSSKEQFAFRLQWTTDGKARDKMLVLRMRPTASIVETHPLREYQAIEAVKSVIPVPPLYWIDPHGDELGQAALIYGYVEGITRPPSSGPYTPRQGFGPIYRRLLAPQFVRYFAELAKFDWRQSVTSAFDIPTAGANDGVIKTINWWERVWEEDSIEPYPLMRVVGRWLRDHAPPIDQVSMVHGDLRGGNFLFLPDDGRITAVLDWELVHFGDRHEDLAFLFSPLFSERDESGLELKGGFYPRETFIEEYERRSGMAVDPQRLAYYDVLSCWRGAINALATAPRVMMGQKTHQDIRVGWIINSAPIVMQAMLKALKGLL